MSIVISGVTVNCPLLDWAAAAEAIFAGVVLMLTGVS